MTIITKGMGVVLKVAKKSWKDKRISAINRKIKKTSGRSAEDYAQEASDIYKSKAPSKKLYKSIQKKFHGLTSDQQSEIWMKKAKRTPGNIHFDKKRFGKK